MPAKQWNRISLYWIGFKVGFSKSKIIWAEQELKAVKVLEEAWAFNQEMNLPILYLERRIIIMDVFIVPN